MRNRKILVFAIGLGMLLPLVFQSLAVAADPTAISVSEPVDKPVSEGDGCTLIAVGKDASADGSAIVAYNDDSGVGDVRTWIIPAKDWPAGSTKDILVDSHSYGDFGKWPYGNFPAPEVAGGTQVVGTMPQVNRTLRYFHTRYSFANEKGVVMGETTLSPNGPRSDEIVKVLGGESGLIDMWFLMDVALQRASTAREAVQVMGSVMEQYRWYGGMEPGSGESAAITDGNEVWIVEFYGADVWVAKRLPDDQVFVSANRARMRQVDLNDKANVMYSPNLVNYAVSKGWYDPNSGTPFYPADVYMPSNARTSSTREFVVLSNVAPSLNLKFDDKEPYYSSYPFSVKPDKKLTVDDVFKLEGNNLQGTQFDLTRGPGAGPYGNPIPGGPGRARAPNTKTTLYGHVSQVKGWLPDPIKAVSWFGYGARDSGYITPINPNMKELPKFMRTGSRYEDYDVNSAWWVSTRVTNLAEYCYQEAIKDIYAFRQPRLDALYQEVPAMQELAARVYKEDPNAALNIIDNFYYNNLVAMNEDWKQLGDLLQAKYNANNPRKAIPAYPDWWNELIDLAASAVTASAQTTPEFKLGFKALADQIPDVVDAPLENEYFNLFNGNSEQHTTKGLMVWRKIDNWTAFTNGYMTWINGPYGVQSRLNTDRFDWEKDTVVSAPAPAPIAAPAPAPSNPSPAAASGIQSESPAGN